MSTKHRRVFLSSVGVLVLGGLAWAIMVSRSPEPLQQDALDQQIASIARRYGFEPVLPPMTNVRLLSTSSRSEIAETECWDARTDTSSSFANVETLTAKLAEDSTSTSLQFLKRVGLSFSGTGDQASAVRLSLGNWAVVSAHDLRFRWENEQCWELLQIGPIPVIGRALEFGNLKTEILSNSGATIRIDSLSLRGSGANAVTRGQHLVNANGAVSAEARGVVVGIVTSRFVAQPWSCPAVGYALLKLGDDLRAIDHCPTRRRGEFATWYRARIIDSGKGKHSVEYQKIGQSDGNIHVLPIVLGAEQTIAVRTRTLDRIILERQTDSTFTAVVHRYELRPLKAASVYDRSISDPVSVREMHGLSYLWNPSTRLDTFSLDTLAVLRGEHSPLRVYPVDRIRQPTVVGLDPIFDYPYSDAEADQPLQIEP